MSIPHSWKHGPFDPRYPLIPHRVSPSSLWRLGEERTDWEAFLAGFFPGHRRHDFDALAAYESYRNDLSGRHPRADKAKRGEAEEKPPEATETERWEGEGGAAVGRLPRRLGGERGVRPQRV
jgi:hypothetical protein